MDELRENYWKVIKPDKEVREDKPVCEGADRGAVEGL